MEANLELVHISLRKLYPSLRNCIEIDNTNLGRLQATVRHLKSIVESGILSSR